MRFQPLSPQPIPLLDARSNPQVIVYAQLLPGFQDLDSLERAWKLERAKLPNIEHAHWDWRNKLPSLRLGTHQIVAIEYNGEIQGIMAVQQEPRQSQLDNLYKVLYVDYIESAPWNIRTYSGGFRYAGVGKSLIAAAILLSEKNGLAGRVGLRALSQAAEFYRDQCSMTDLGEDSNYYDLRYFEYNEVDALRWLNIKNYAGEGNR